jgi:hypothetical protein
VPAGLSGVSAIAAGYGHTVALKSDGTVVAWGWNNYGQTDVPAGLSGVSTIAAGFYHTVALKSDGTPPTISIVAPSNTLYLLNQAVVASYSCADESSGVATCAGPVPSGSNIDTASVGAKTFTVQASDNAGNTASQSVSYTVGYAFRGFLAPVNPAPTVNTGKAGKTYPVRWQLTDANGAYTSSLDAVQAITYQSTACNAFSSDPTDALETSTSGGTSLRYDSTANQYVYNWATPASSGCYTLFLTLSSGQVFSAYFNLN